MVLVWEVQELGRDTLQLESVEGSNTLADRKAVVELGMDNHLRRSPVVNELCGIPLFILATVVPKISLELFEG